MTLLYPFVHSMHVYDHTGMWGGYGIIGDMIMFILWIMVIGAVIYFVVRYAGAGQCMPTARPHNSALDILKERYAKGEINKEEFEEKKKDLQ